MHLFSTRLSHGITTRAQAVPARPPAGALEALGSGEGPRAVLLAAVARGRPALPVEAAPARAAGPPPRALEGLDVANLLLRTDDSAQGQVPVTLAKRRDAPRGLRLPVVLLLHATGASKESLAAEQAAFARRGYLAAAFDCRYHGRRSHGSVLAASALGAAPPVAHAAAAPAGALPSARAGYEAALVAAWQGSGERPFLLDNIFDAMRLIDYLCLRPDVDPARIGVAGVSLGGMHSWLLAAADPRVRAAAPMIGVQWFGWAIEHRTYAARVDSIPAVFAAAAADLGAGSVTPQVVTAVWDKLLPGLLESYDAPWSLPLVAPRPMLVINGELDPRCPLEGVQAALGPAVAAYAAAGAPEALRLFVDPGVGHACTPAMWVQAHAWLDAHLLHQQPAPS